MAVTTSRDVARWVLAFERRSIAERCAPGAEAQRACRKLYERLAPLVTDAGCQAFLARSLSQARNDFPFLDDVYAGPTAGACLVGLDEALSGVDAGMAEDAFVEVIANMLNLLVTFIGADLARHAIQGAWAELTISDFGGDESAT